MILKNSLLISIFTVLSVILGVFRDRLLAQFVGVGQTLDILNASFRVPDLFLGILFAFVASSTVIPFISKSIEDNNKQELQEKMSSLFFFFGGAMVLLGIIVVVCLPYVAKFIVPGFSAQAVSEYIKYTSILMLQPILLGLSTLVSTIAQTKQRFVLYGIAPLLYTTSIIISIFLYERFGLSAIVFGVIFGALLHFLVQAIVLYIEKVKISYKFFKKEDVLGQLKIALPRSGSIVISQLRILFFTAFATTLGVGVLTVYVFAERISDAALMVSARSLSAASLPVLSKDISQGKNKDYRDLISKHLKFISISGVIISLAIILMKDSIVTILYGQNIQNGSIALFLTVLMLAFPFASINMYLTNALSASRDTKTVFFANIFATPASIAIAVYLKSLGFGLLSLAIGVASASVLSTTGILTLLIVKKYIYEY